MLNRLLIFLIGIAFLGCEQSDKHSTVLTVSGIDMCIEEIDSDTSLVEAFSDGVMIYDEYTVDYSNYKLYDIGTNELSILTHTEYLDSTIRLIFYYKDDIVIFAKTEKKYNNDDKYSDELEQKFYYSKGEVIYQTNEGEFPLDLYELGLEHLQIHNEEFVEKK
jgi:hypothetical protein